MTDARDALFVGQASDGTVVRRPMSPHLQVYRPQITTVLSIMNRMSGIAISVGTLLMVWWLVALAQGPRPFAVVQSFCGGIVGIVLLLGWTLALCYHFFGGLRHLAWDWGVGFDLPSVHRSGWLAVGATFATFVAIWVVALLVWL